jgi:hypothetical protein
MTAVSVLDETFDVSEGKNLADYLRLAQGG